MSESGNVRLELRWRRCSQIHSDDECGTDFYQGQSTVVDTYANSAALRTALLHWCYSSRNFGANPTVSAGNGTSADDDLDAS